MASPLRIALVGCGKMGGALLHGWRGIPNLDITVIDPHARGDRHPGTTYIPDASVLPANTWFDVTVLAVKPNDTDAALTVLHPHITLETTILSVVAGKTISTLSSALDGHPRIIRAMPNLPASIGAGITAVFTAVPSCVAVGDLLLSPVGDVIWLNDEEQMDTVTALSGSGPAYVFLLIEVLTRAGIDLGLPLEIAEKLARQTVIGSALLAREQFTVSAEQLRDNVTSKGGTTAAALTVLNDQDALYTLFVHALSAAKTRAHELNG